jgi:hypothetical protein
VNPASIADDAQARFAAAAAEMHEERCRAARAAGFFDGLYGRAASDVSLLAEPYRLFYSDGRMVGAGALS